MQIRTGAIIFSRFSSRRLPGKALLPLGNTSLLEQVISNAKNLDVDEIIVATSNNIDDNKIEDLSSKNGVKCFRGSLENVAERCAQALQAFGIDYFIRLNGDSPIIPVLELNELLKNKSELIKYDLISNLIERTFPYGYSIEIVRSKSFLLNQTNFSELQSEHITSYFYENATNFKFRSITYSGGIENLSKYTLTVDDKASYEQMKALFEQINLKTSNQIETIISKLKFND